MHCPFYWIDAFTDRVFGGNPAAVCPLEAWPGDRLLQQIARQNGLAETAYTVRAGPGRYHLRWFTPEVEMDLCGHATLATAHVLFTELHAVADEVMFDTRSGALRVTRDATGRLVLDFPARPATPLPAEQIPVALRDGLGATPLWVGKSRDYLCILPHADAVRNLRPDLARLAQLDDTIGIIVSARGEDCDFVSRFFAPRAGVPEDPVTGSAHCTLVPYWAEVTDGRQFHARQLSSRGGELWCTLAGDRVHLAGRSVTYIRGQLSVD